jgi:hypothetical protein
MPVTPVKGKQCTLEIGATTYTGWVQGLDSGKEKSTETVATWGEDVAFTGSQTNTGELTFLFDPMTSALGPALETAFDTDAAVTLTVKMGPAATQASRVYTNWKVASYSDSAPAEGLVSCKASLIGSSSWVTTYDTP